MGHSPNFGLVTDMKGPVLDALTVTGLTVANGQLCTIAEDCGAGLVASVTHTNTGVYTFQMAVPYYPKRVNVQCELSTSGAATAVLQARYQEGSYNATTGQFIIDVTNTAGAAADPASTNELHVLLVLRRYTANP